MTTTVTCVVEAAIEAPHLIYPRGPIRKIVTIRHTEDEVAGPIVLVTLECKHSATLVGLHLTHTALVRCPMCFFDKQQSGVTRTVIDNEEKNV